MDKENKFTRQLGFRRRIRSASGVAYPDNKTQIDDSSSNSKDVGVSNIYHSDSNDINSASQPIKFALLSKHLMHLELDSVNKNFTLGRPFAKRIRKNKKMIVDTDVKFRSQMTGSCSECSSSENGSTTCHSACMPSKRKRSNREIIAGHQGTSNIKSMDIDIASSSSSISSSDIEDETYSNDEGRGGDDDAEPINIDCQKLLSVNLQNKTLSEGRGLGCMPIWHGNTFLKSDIEICRGLRKVLSVKSSFSVLTSANNKVSRFLKDPVQSELRHHPMPKNEQDNFSTFHQ